MKLVMINKLATRVKVRVELNMDEFIALWCAVRDNDLYDPDWTPQVQAKMYAEFTDMNVSIHEAPDGTRTINDEWDWKLMARQANYVCTHCNQSQHDVIHLIMHIRDVNKVGLAAAIDIARDMFAAKPDPNPGDGGATGADHPDQPR